MDDSDAVRFLSVLMGQLRSLGYEVVMEHGGWSLYDRRRPAGQQLIGNFENMDRLIRGVFLEILTSCDVQRKYR